MRGISFFSALNDSKSCKLLDSEPRNEHISLTMMNV